MKFPQDAARKTNNVTLFWIRQSCNRTRGSMTTTAPPPKILVPAAPPRVIDDVYTDEQHARMVDVIKREGPWPTIISHHFETVDELIATTSGVIPPDHGLTLDDIAGPHFRGFFAKNSVCFYPELEDIFYNSRFLAEVKSYWNADYAKPTLMLFNICGPHNTGLAPHLDAVTFRGVRIENTPVWMQNIMGKSGLFKDYLVKMAQVITWWYRGSPGGFTYWPEGPFEPPQVLHAPMWNRGVVVQNEMMYHRGDPVGPPADRAIEASRTVRCCGTYPTRTRGLSRPTIGSSSVTGLSRSGSSRTGMPRSTRTWRKSTR